MTDEEKQLENNQREIVENPGLTESISGDSTAAEMLQPKDELQVDERSGVEVQPTSAEATESTNYTVALAELSQTVGTLTAQLEERTSQYLRIAADFENFRKRTQKEREDLEVQIKCSTLSELLPVVDNFERARLQIKPVTEPEMTIHKSYQSVYKQLVDCLKRVGVSPMRSEGQPFDPSFHEAVMREPTDQHEEGIVIEELVRGYVLGERVLRHALVKVAAPLEPTPNEELEVS
jgi:molecular chaperone GrpE